MQEKKGKEVKQEGKKRVIKINKCIQLYTYYSNFCSATSKSLWGMLLGRLFVGTGMGLGPPVAALYVAEV
jgi:uncharacterized membrane protein